jgi:hypothetical protein
VATDLPRANVRSLLSDSCCASQPAKITGVSLDDESYLKRAVELGSSPAMRQDARESLARAHKAGFPLTDTASRAVKLTAALDRLFGDWNRKVETARTQTPDLLAERIAKVSIEVGERMSSSRTSIWSRRSCCPICAVAAVAS